MSHSEVTAECCEIFKRINDKLNILLDADKVISCKYEDHIKTSLEYRVRVEQHDIYLKNIMDLKRWWLWASSSLVAGVVSLAVVWGGVVIRVDHLEKRVYNSEKLRLASIVHED